MPIIMIAAIDNDRGIGVNNELPWHYPEDLKLFRSLTWGHAVILGRKTMDSIKEPLPNREHFILSKQDQTNYNNVYNNMNLAITAAKAKHSHVFIIGGATIFAQSFSLIDAIYLTRINHNHNADTFFPEIPAQFIKTNKYELTKTLSFEIYKASDLCTK